MNQANISQKFQTSNIAQPLLGFVSRSIEILFMEYQNIVRCQIQEDSIINDTLYSSLADKITAFTNLQKNWDSYDADLISETAIDIALETLNQLNNRGQLTNGLMSNVFPMRDGGIQFEFDGVNICAELEINEKGDFKFILFDDFGNIINNPMQPFELSTLSTLLEEAEYA